MHGPFGVGGGGAGEPGLGEEVGVEGLVRFCSLFSLFEAVQKVGQGAGEVVDGLLFFVLLCGLAV